MFEKLFVKNVFRWNSKWTDFGFEWAEFELKSKLFPFWLKITRPIELHRNWIDCVGGKWIQNKVSFMVISIVIVRRAFNSANDPMLFARVFALANYALIALSCHGKCQKWRRLARNPLDLAKTFAQNFGSNQANCYAMSKLAFSGSAWHHSGIMFNANFKNWNIQCVLYITSACRQPHGVCRIELVYFL